MLERFFLHGGAKKTFMYVIVFLTGIAICCMMLFLAGCQSEIIVESEYEDLELENENTVSTTASSSTAKNEENVTKKATNSTQKKVENKVTTSVKKQETTKNVATTTKNQTTATTKDPYETIQLNVKTTYHGYTGYFTKSMHVKDVDNSILGLPEDYLCVGAYISEYYDVEDDKNIYFAVDTNVVEYPIFSSIIDSAEGRFMVPVRTKG